VRLPPKLTARVGRRHPVGRADGERNTVNPVSVETFEHELVACERGWHDDGGGLAARDVETSFVEAHPVRGERLRVTEERDVVDRDDERRGTRRYRETRCVAHVDVEVDVWPSIPVPELVSPTRCARTETPELDGTAEPRVEGPAGATRTRGERDDIDVLRELVTQHLRDPADSAGDLLRELADVDADPQA